MRRFTTPMIMLAGLSLALAGCASSHPATIEDGAPRAVRVVDAPISVQDYSADLAAFIAERTSEDLDAPAKVVQDGGGATMSTAADITSTNQSSDADEIADNLGDSAAATASAEDVLLTKDTEANTAAGVKVTAIRVTVKSATSSLNDDGSTTVNDEVIVVRDLASGPAWESEDVYTSVVQPDGTIRSLTQPDVSDFDSGDASQGDADSSEGGASLAS